MVPMLGPVTSRAPCHGRSHPDRAEADDPIVHVGSVTLAAGRPLLPRRITTPALTLTSVQRIGPGFAELRYDVPRGA